MLLILSLLVIAIGITYAYYSAVVHGTGNTNATTSANTATLGEVEFNGTSTFDSSTLDDIYPGYIGIQTFTIGPYKNGTGIYEVDLEATVPQAFGNDIKLTIYKTNNHTSNYLTRTEGTLTVNNNRYVKQDTVTTTGTLTKVYESSLTTTTETMIEQVEFVIANNAFTTPTVTPDGYYTYYAVYEYLDNENQNNQQGLNFSSKITVKYVSELYIPESLLTLQSLQDLNSNLVVTPSTASNPDFSIIAPRAANVDNDGKAAQTSGLFEAQDDYGTSYYFRGDVTNNYVKFGEWQTDYYNGYVSDNDNYEGFISLSACQESASNCTKYASAGDGMYWRIIRINGDGSIRMIYDGTSAHDKDDSECYNGDTRDLIPANIRSIGTGEFNAIPNYNDNAYVGYMYGASASNNYNDTHTNTNDSTIKIRLDSWYQSQMMGYASYVSDTLFCNDRSVASNNVISYVNNNWNPSQQYTQNAYGTNNALYAPYGRLIEEFSLGEGNKATFECSNKNDAFTVSDTMHGNGSLTYPVGLITIDEANMAGGGLQEDNYDYYLISGAFYWALSPYGFDTYYAGISGVNYGGALDFYVLTDNYLPHALRPVINLKADVITAGDGTANNPFRIQ